MTRTGKGGRQIGSGHGDQHPGREGHLHIIHKRDWPNRIPDDYVPQPKPLDRIVYSAPYFSEDRKKWLLAKIVVLGLTLAPFLADMVDDL